MRSFLAPALVFSSLLFIGCGKKVDCNNAELCVKNTGTDTIYFCWGCNMYEDTLAPGEKACQFVGEVYISSTEETVKWVDFVSSKGTYRIKVDDCYVEKEIQ